LDSAADRTHSLICDRRSTALLASWNEPQVAGKLNLYQTNIMLQGSTLAADPNIPPALYDALIGKEAMNLAKTQYQEARTTTRDTADELQKKLPPATTSPAKPTPESNAFQKANYELQEINLDLGLIQAVQKQPIAAQQLWQQIERDIPGSSIATTAEVLNQLWTAEKPVPAKAESIITKNLQGWFEYQSLKQLYTKQAATDKLKTLESQQISAATGSVYRNHGHYSRWLCNLGNWPRSRMGHCSALATKRRLESTSQRGPCHAAD
jgi:uncharacterized protein